METQVVGSRKMKLIERVGGMYKANYKLAGFPVCICSVYTDIHNMCVDYWTEETPVVFVTTSMKGIEEERKRSAEGGDNGLYEDGYIETLLVYRKLALEFMNRGVLLMHGSAIAVDGVGYLFTALSGTGKSTHTRLWREMLGDKAMMINDDKPLIRVREGDVPVIYGTPWDGKHHLSNNIAVPLKAIIYLERGEENEIHGVSSMEMFPILLQQTFRENDMLTTSKVLELLSRLADNVKFFDLHCNMEKEAAEVAYNGVSGC